MSDEEGFDENILEFGVEKDKIRVESDRETMSFSSSNERIKEMPIDGLSELPNSLLIHILSFLGVKKLGLLVCCRRDGNFFGPNCRRWNSGKFGGVIYSCSSLIALHISGGGCIMSYERTIEWQSLTDLTLSNVMLNQHLLDEILSSCTVLKSLALDECWWSILDVLKVLHLKNLKMNSLNIVVFPRERKWQLRNISSVVTAYINFFDVYDYSLEVMGKATEFLENFKHVDDLEVRRLCFEFLSIMAVNGWQLPQFKLRNLTIVSCSEYEHVIPGIMCLLESSPNLETLVLEGYETEGKLSIWIQR